MAGEILSLLLELPLAGNFGMKVVARQLEGK